MWTGLDRNKEARMTKAKSILDSLTTLIQSGETKHTALAERISKSLSCGIEPNPHDLNWAEAHIERNKKCQKIK